MKIVFKMFWFLIEVIALIIGLLVLIGLFTSDPFPHTILFWNCVSWSACFLMSSSIYLMISLVPIVIIRWVVLIRKRRADRS